MTRTPTSDWFRLAASGAQLWADANEVIWLRSWQMMSGHPAAGAEAVRMVTEKMEAGAELATRMAFSPPSTPAEAALTAIRHYSPKVRRNRRRLSRVNGR